MILLIHWEMVFRILVSFNPVEGIFVILVYLYTFLDPLNTKKLT